MNGFAILAYVGLDYCHPLRTRWRQGSPRLPGDKISGTASLPEIAASQLPMAPSTAIITPKIGDHALGYQ